jgi:two-component system, OmpR family, sensor histidine kinase KdpD
VSPSALSEIKILDSRPTDPSSAEEARAEGADPESTAANLPATAAMSETADASAVDARVLIAICADEHAEPLIKAGKRIADECSARWTVVHVQTSTYMRAGAEAVDRLAQAFCIAESLGGETVTLDGSSVAQTLVRYLRTRQFSRIVVGSGRRRGLKRWLGHDVVSMLLDAQVRPEVIVVRDYGLRSERGASEHHAGPAADSAFAISQYAAGLGITALCTAVAFPLYPRFDSVNIVMVYLLGTTLAGLRLGRMPSALTAVANVATFDFFFVPPRYSFYISEVQYIFTFGVMLGVALVISQLVVSVRSQTEAAVARERRTATSYAMSRELAVAPTAEGIAAATACHVGAVVDGTATILFPDEHGSLVVANGGATAGQVVDMDIASWVLNHRLSAGPGMQRPLPSPALYLPLSGGGSANGVLVAWPAQIHRLLPEQRRMLETLASQAAFALERVRLSELAAQSRTAAERAALRNTLLASISHDLRGPLAAIAGAGSLVAQSSGPLVRHRHRTLGLLIEEKARDMSGLLSNILELIRLETTSRLPNGEWHVLEELIGTAIRNNEHRLDRWHVTSDIPADFPLLFVDGHLIVQLLSNLLENATKYTPQGTSIEIAARILESGEALLTIQDDGPGFGARNPDRLFEKFERGRFESSVSGVGLGLAICRAIARLHDGDIKACNRDSGGARFEILLPLRPPPPAVSIENA